MRMFSVFGKAEGEIRKGRLPANASPVEFVCYVCKTKAAPGHIEDVPRGRFFKGRWAGTAQRKADKPEGWVSGAICSTTCQEKGKP